ncbi:C-terminal binding protein [uncultured Thalassospira sp.]|uniref:C-terminal binding protein n=1 Tax=uncultured Thalassospira sp. TaxID=404382 RepID=UPI002584E23D|nr:C-terminal binding protein [uncultured Thalassospira sp.]
MANEKSKDVFRIGVTDYVEPVHDVEARPYGADVEIRWLDFENAESDVPVGDLDALLVWHSHVDQGLVERLTNCKIVVRYGVGFDNIDIEALNAAGIAFSNTPDYGTEEVADTAVSMLLTHLRKLPEYDYRCRHYENGWQEHVLSPLKRSNQTTIGIVGLGRIGSAVALRLKAFGFDVCGFDPYRPSGHEKTLGIRRYDDLTSMLSQCDAVTLHCPLNEKTQGLISEDFVYALPSGGLLVNTARGGLIASLDVLSEALRSGHLYAVALDVLPDEPPTDHPLIHAWRNEEPWLRGRLTINPHSAYFSDAALYEMRYKCAETAFLYLSRGLHRNAIGRDFSERA